jgi:hypothetical protein
MGVPDVFPQVSINSPEFHQASEKFVHLSACRLLTACFKWYYTGFFQSERRASCADHLAWHWYLEI